MRESVFECLSWNDTVEHEFEAKTFPEFEHLSDAKFRSGADEGGAAGSPTNQEKSSKHYWRDRCWRGATKSWRPNALRSTRPEADAGTVGFPLASRSSNHIVTAKMFLRLRRPIVLLVGIRFWEVGELNRPIGIGQSCNSRPI